MQRFFPNYDAFRISVVNHIESNAFPHFYQSIGDQLSSLNPKDIAAYFGDPILGFQRLLIFQKLFSTRLSEDGLENVRRLVMNLNLADDWSILLGKFSGIGTRSKQGTTITQKIDQFSFGSKFLHFLSPDNWPIIDSVVIMKFKERKSKVQLSMEICKEYKLAADRFLANEGGDYISRLSTDKKVSVALTAAKLTPRFPKMKWLDMAMFQSGT